MSYNPSVVQTVAAAYIRSATRSGSSIAVIRVMHVSVYSLPIVPRYAEVDQQGVVFNGHYLTWFDEACTGLLDAHGFGYPALLSAGFDFQVVHSEIDFLAPVRWRDGVRVTAECLQTGTTSFTVGFGVHRQSTGADQLAVRGHNVYVVVSTGDWTKRPIPTALRNALGSSATG